MKITSNSTQQRKKKRRKTKNWFSKRTSRKFRIVRNCIEKNSAYTRIMREIRSSFKETFWKTLDEEFIEKSYIVID